MVVSFLYTGIPEFYERLGWRVVLEPGFHASADEAASVPRDPIYAVRRVEESDVPALTRLYNASIAGSTGAVVRTPRTWRDEDTWLGLDPAGTLVAEHAGRIVAYIRCAARDYGYTLLEAEHAHTHAAAASTLLAEATKAATARNRKLNALVPHDHALAVTLRTLPSTTSSTDRSHVPHPMMMRLVSLEGLLEALLPQIRGRARTHRGSPFAMTLHAPDGERATLAFTGAKASLRRRTGEHELDERAMLDVLLGQRRASRLVRPRPPRDVARRIDAIFPETPLHFWNSDRI
jgi:hypothetical protein